MWCGYNVSGCDYNLCHFVGVLYGSFPEIDLRYWAFLARRGSRVRSTEGFGV